MNGEEIQPENPQDFAYKLDITKIKSFDDIKTVEDMRSFHEQRLKDEKERGKSFNNSMRPKS